jgi:hypothetical protein
MQLLAQLANAPVQEPDHGRLRALELTGNFRQGQPAQMTQLDRLALVRSN